MGLHGADNWVKIAAHVGHGVSRQQCRSHWNKILYNTPQVYIKGFWSDDEVRSSADSK